MNRHTDQKQRDLPIQPVHEPILCSPYAEPTEHWVYDTSTGEASRFPGWRPAGYWFKTRRTGEGWSFRMVQGFVFNLRRNLIRTDLV